MFVCMVTQNMDSCISKVLRQLGLGEHVHKFVEQKISVDIVCQLSEYDFQCLGVTNRAKIMELRTKCIKYGDVKPAAVDGQFQIPKETIESLLDIGFTVADMSKMLSVSESTLYRRMRKYNLSKKDFTHISDDSLDEIVLKATLQYPHNGESMLRKILSQQGIKIQRYRLRDSLHRVDEKGIAARKKGRLHRRVYNVTAPNHLWHIDTNHKLIRWKFVIAGGIDGFSRLVTFLECTDNNKATTLLDCFLKGIHEFGTPLRARSDKGLENTLIADFMIRHRGVGRGSMITGKSVHNQRIERLWRDVFVGVLSYFYNLFYYMEDSEILDPFNESHIFALHHVFLKEINKKLGVWRNAWANHRIRTTHLSPIQMFTAGAFNHPTEQLATDLETFRVEDDTATNEEQENQRPIFSSPSFSVNERCRAELNYHCPREWTSNNFGMDIYQKAVEIINSFAMETD